MDPSKILEDYVTGGVSSFSFKGENVVQFFPVVSLPDLRYLSPDF